MNETIDSYFKEGDIVRILPLEEIPNIHKDVCGTPARTLYGGLLARVTKVWYQKFGNPLYVDNNSYDLAIMRGDDVIISNGWLSVGLSKVFDYVDYITPNKNEKLVLQVNKNKSKIKFNFN